MSKKARLEILGEDNQVLSTQIVDDFNPLEPNDSHNIPEGTRKFQLTLLNEDDTEADQPEVFVVGTRSEIISILKERNRDTQLKMFTENHGDAPETTEFVAMDQGDMLSHIRKLR